MRYQPVGLPESSLQGVFDEDQTVYTYYRTVLQFEDRIMAGTPADPDIVRGWLASKMGVSDEVELLNLTAETMQSVGITEARQGMTTEELRAIADQYAAEKSTNVFRRFDGVGLYLEGRCLKAGFKESINSLYPHERSWGLTGKSVKGMAAERVHAKQGHLFLCQPADPYEFDPSEWTEGVRTMTEPSGIETFVGHTNGPKGPQSNLTRVEYVVQPRIYATVEVAEDFIPADQWPRVWVHLQEIGLGSLRSQSQGKFKVLQFQRVFEGDRMPKKTEKAPKKTAARNGTASAEEILASV
jgi:hypothetical protein